jgi:predicted DNA-binding protein
MASRMVSTSWGSKIMRLPKIRHALSSLALARTRLSDQPYCLANSAGVMGAGSIMYPRNSPLGLTVISPGHIDVKSNMAWEYHMSKRPTNLPTAKFKAALETKIPAERFQKWASTLQITSRESDKFILRLPDGMRERLAEVAESQGRTMNAVVIGALAENLAGAKTFERRLDEIEKAIRALTEAVAEINKR